MFCKWYNIHGSNISIMTKYCLNFCGMHYKIKLINFTRVSKKSIVFIGYLPNS